MIMKLQVDWSKTSPHAGPPIELAALETQVENPGRLVRNSVRVIPLPRPPTRPSASILTESTVWLGQAAVDGQVGQKRFHFPLAHLLTMNPLTCAITVKVCSVNSRCRILRNLLQSSKCGDCRGRPLANIMILISLENQKFGTLNDGVAMSRRLITLFATLGIALPAFLAASGCSSRITKTNADQVTTGMSEKVVTDLLGSPTTHILTPTAMQAFWKDGSNIITVTFVDGKVVAKTFADDGSEASPWGEAAARDAAAVSKPDSSSLGYATSLRPPPSILDVGNDEEEHARRMREQDRWEQELAERQGEYDRQAREALLRSLDEPTAPW
jgi:hypothetical protein